MYMNKEYLDALIKNDKKTLNKIKEKMNVKKLYKYMSFDSKGSARDTDKILAISSDKIWLSRVDKLNDPFECWNISLDPDKLIGLLNRQSPEYSVNKDFMYKFVNFMETYFEKYRNEFLICSMTKSGISNMPLWAHYSNNSKGFVLEYEVIDTHMMEPVNYAHSKLGIESLFFSEIAKILQDDEYPPNVINAIQFYNILTKHISWSYEEEIRIVSINDEGLENGKLVNTKDVGIRLSAIYTGMQCCEKHVEWLKYVAEHKEIPLKSLQMNIVNSGYYLGEKSY